MSLPRVQPIIPISRKQPFDDPTWLFDFKYDGFRALCYVEHHRGRLVSRNGNHLARFDELGDQIAALLDLDEALLDGEVIAADATGRPQFYELLRRARAPAYVAFDIVWAMVPTCAPCHSASAGCACRAFCQKDRSEALSVEGRGRHFFDLTQTHDLEGIVAKRLADPYAPRQMAQDQEPGLHAEGGRGDLFNGPPRSAR